MKTLITIIALGITFLSYSQEPNNQSPLIELEDVNVSAVNSSYLTTVQDTNTPQEVVLLQREAARFDVRSTSEFSEDVLIGSFEMVFKNAKGSIDTFYDNNGKITSAYERFRNIQLPRAIQRELYQEHKGWAMTANLYASAYEGDHLIDRSYKIQLERGDTKKSIVIHK